jgi:hypothetical protein
VHAALAILRIWHHDLHEGEQLRRALSSIALNVAAAIAEVTVSRVFE